jgi:hypothetical protein
LEVEEAIVPVCTNAKRDETHELTPLRGAVSMHVQAYVQPTVCTTWYDGIGKMPCGEETHNKTEPQLQLGLDLEQ